MSELTHKVLVAPGFLPTEEEREKRDKDAGPLGEELANLLAAGLEARGWRVEYRWTTFEGHAFDARRKEQRYDVEITSLDTSATLTNAGPRPPDAWQGLWALVAKRRSGLFSRFWSKRYDVDEHALLRLHIDEVLAEEARVAASGRNGSEGPRSAAAVSVGPPEDGPEDTAEAGAAPSDTADGPMGTSGEWRSEADFRASV